MGFSAVPLAPPRASRERATWSEPLTQRIGPSCRVDVRRIAPILLSRPSTPFFPGEGVDVVRAPQDDQIMLRIKPHRQAGPRHMLLGLPDREFAEVKDRSCQ